MMLSTSARTTRGASFAGEAIAWSTAGSRQTARRESAPPGRRRRRAVIADEESNYVRFRCRPANGGSIDIHANSRVRPLQHADIDTAGRLRHRHGDADPRPRLVALIARVVAHRIVPALLPVLRERIECRANRTA